MANNAPFNNLEDIARRKEELRKQIRKQEQKLSNDFEAYQDDVDNFKYVWERISSLRKLREHNPVGSIASSLSSITGKPGLMTVVSVGAKVLRWLWKKRK